MSDLLELTPINLLEFIRQNPHKDVSSIATYFEGGAEVKIHTTREFQTTFQKVLSMGEIYLDKEYLPYTVDNYDPDKTYVKHNSR